MSPGLDDGLPAQGVGRGETVTSKAVGGSGTAFGRIVDELVGRYGGLPQLLSDLDSADKELVAPAKEVLRHIVSVAVDNRVPLPPPCSKFNDANFEERFVNEICAKLKPTLRKLPEAVSAPHRLRSSFAHAVQRQCERSRRVFLARYEQGATQLLAEEEDRRTSARQREHRDDVGLGEWFARVLDGQWVPPHTAEVLKYLEAWADEPRADRSPLNDEGTLDARALAGMLGLTPGEVTKIMRIVRKEGAPVRETPRRQFRKVHKRLLKFASEPWGSLADAELREEMFRLARDLAFSFGPDDAIAKGAKLLDRAEFSGAINVLLDERSLAEVHEQRTVLERQMQTILKICDALERNQLDEAYKLSGAFLLDAARVQHHTSPERLQVLLAYSHLLHLGKQWQAYVDVNRAVVDRCDELARHKGESELDETPEFENAVTLRRIRTYAKVNAASCLFHNIVSTARTNVFRVTSYPGLAALAERLREVIADDPDASTVQDELLVIQAHVFRAAHNRFRDRHKTDHDHWRRERDRQRALLMETIETHFFDKARQIPDAARLTDAAHTAEGGAVDRTLDILDQMLNAYPGVLQELRQERLAKMHIAAEE